MARSERTKWVVCLLCLAFVLYGAAQVHICVGRCGR